jgi:DNA-binding IclR family transcriptional regulator
MKKKPDITEPSDPHFVTALARGLEVLRCFDANHRVLGTTQISARTGLPQPTVWRLCYTLQKLGYLTQASNEDKLRLGAQVLALGSAALSGMPSLDLARPLMQAFADRFRAAVALGQQDRDCILYLQRCQGDSPLLTNLRVGSRIPIYRSAIGWALVAALPDELRTQILADLIPNGEQVAEQAFADAMTMYKECGFVMNFGVQHKDVNTVAVPIIRDTGVIYCLSCGGPVSSLTRKLMNEQVGPQLVELAGQLKPIFSLNL